MHWKVEHSVDQARIDYWKSQQVDGMEFVKKQMAVHLADKLLKSITVTSYNPAPAFKPLPGELNLTFIGEVVHLPIEQWRYVKQMLHLLATSPETKRIVATIIDEVENK